MEHLFANCHQELSFLVMWGTSLPFLGVYVKYVWGLDNEKD